MDSDTTLPDAPEAVRLWQQGIVTDTRYLAPRLSDVPYINLMRTAHRELSPRRYFEIGTQKGRSLALASCPSVAVDPRFMLPDGFAEARPHLQLFPTTSDAFFKAHDLTQLLGGSVDLAFLDGMHRFEYLLRDFMNAERHCATGSVILLHDCVPVSTELVYRRPGVPRRPEFDVMPKAWAGDVWKLLPILREHRPDLRLTVFDAGPTGLVFVTGLDPASRVLEENYEAIVAKYMDLDLAQIGLGDFLAAQSVQPTRPALARGALPGMIGLT
jgi:hypothetical protein